MDEEAAVEPTWGEPDARKGKEARGEAGENGTEPFGGKTQTVPEDHAAKVHEGRGRVRDGGEPGERVWGTKVERTGRKEGEGSSRETHREQEQGDLWRTGTDRETKW